MKVSDLKKLGQEIDTVVRLRAVSEADVCRRIVEFIDHEFHGVVPLIPEKDMSQRDIPNGNEPMRIKPDKPLKVGT